MKQNQFTWNWYHWELVNLSQWTILEPLYYSSFFFATLVYGVIGNKFCWLLPQSRSTSWTRISWDTNWARIRELATIQGIWSETRFCCFTASFCWWFELWLWETRPTSNLQKTPHATTSNVVPITHPGLTLTWSP